CSSADEQPLFPIRGGLMRATYMIKRGLDHLRHLDFSTIPGYVGYIAWKVGLVKFWWRHVIPKMEKPAREIRRRRETQIEVIEVLEG
ncbi:MAG: hypothetical protein ACI9GW_003579, partial [Halieaceae bacterium]